MNTYHLHTYGFFLILMIGSVTENNASELLWYELIITKIVSDYQPCFMPIDLYRQPQNYQIYIRKHEPDTIKNVFPTN